MPSSYLDLSDLETLRDHGFVVTTISDRLSVSRPWQSNLDVIHIQRYHHQIRGVKLRTVPEAS